MRAFFAPLFFLCFALPYLCADIEPLQKRSFNDIFPNISPVIRNTAFTVEGYFQSHNEVLPSNLIGSGQSNLDPQITNAVLSRDPSFLVETVVVIPGNENEYSLLDIYNALGKVRGLQGRPYHSFTRDEEIPLFEDVTRIESARRNVPIDDPPPAMVIPSSETIYVRLKDINFGNSFYRGEMTLDQRGIRYSLTNNRNLTYLFLPVVREEKFIAQLYFELISEGILIYALSGIDVSNFVSSRIDMASAISKRLAVIISWVAGGITG